MDQNSNRNGFSYYILLQAIVSISTSVHLFMVSRLAAICYRRWLKKRKAWRKLLMSGCINY